MVAAGAAAFMSGCVAPPTDRPAPIPPPIPAPVSIPTPAPAPVVVPSSLRLTGTPVQGGLVRGQASPGVTALMLDGQPVALAADGAFVIGFDRDAGRSAQLLELTGARVVATHLLSIAPRAWRIERVDAPYRAGKTDAEFARARPAELAAITAARAIRTDAEGWRGPLRWPATGRQSGWFGSQRVYQGKPGGYHSGADVAVPTGTPVLAPADGVVILAADRPFTLEGNLLMLDHGVELNSALLHLSRIDVRVGERVRQGQRVGLSGATGRATGPHLHWSLRWGEAKLDPLLVAGPLPSGE